MAYRHERTTKTTPDGAVEDYQLTERSGNQLLELCMVPIGLTATGVACWLVLQIGGQLGRAINPPAPYTASHSAIQK